MLTSWVVKALSSIIELLLVLMVLLIFGMFIVLVGMGKTQEAFLVAAVCILIIVLSFGWMSLLIETYKETAAVRNELGEIRKLAESVITQYKSSVQVDSNSLWVDPIFSDNAEPAFTPNVENDIFINNILNALTEAGCIVEKIPERYGYSYNITTPNRTYFGARSVNQLEQILIDLN